MLNTLQHRKQGLKNLRHSFDYLGNSIAHNTKISTNNLSADQILDALEVDMEFLKQEIALAEANELLKQKK